MSSSLEVEAICKLLKDNWNHEKVRCFKNIILANSEVINEISTKNKIEMYNVISMNGNNQINNFLTEYNSNYATRKNNKELLVFNSQNSDGLVPIMKSIPRCLRLFETYPPSKRRWLLNKDHLNKGHSELVVNLMDRTIYIDEDYKRILNEII